MVEKKPKKKIEDCITIKELNSDFRNKYKLMLYVNTLKNGIILIKPLLEEFLKETELTEFSFKELDLKNKIIHISVTDAKRDENGYNHLGNVSRVKSTGEIIMPLNIVKDVPIVNYFELMESFIHEFLHFFISGEEKIVEVTNLFLKNLNYQTKEELARIWGIDIKKTKLLEEKNV